MRRFVVLAALILAACGQPEPPAQEAVADPSAPSAVHPNDLPADVAYGPLIAVSNTAMSITGDLSYTPALVSFANGIEVRTTRLATGAAFDLMAANGETFDAAAPGADDRTVDLRRVDGQTLTNSPQGGLCGDTAPSYIAILNDVARGDVAVIAFTGADAPGATAVATAVCATYSYAVSG